MLNCKIQEFKNCYCSRVFIVGIGFRRWRRRHRRCATSPKTAASLVTRGVTSAHHRWQWRRTLVNTGSRRRRQKRLCRCGGRAKELRTHWQSCARRRSGVHSLVEFAEWRATKRAHGRQHRSVRERADTTRRGRGRAALNLPPDGILVRRRRQDARPTASGSASAAHIQLVCER